MISTRYGTALLQKGGVFLFRFISAASLLRGRLFFFQIRPEDTVQQERVNVGCERKAEEEPAARVKRHQLKVLIGHVHRQNRNDGNGQRRRKMHEGEEERVFQQFPGCVGKSGNHGKDIERHNDQKAHKCL